ncbi:hypothetical protein BDZ45DRAFT_745521 [Acephala macrosclerotiorum]|nr:hypothetical protein BDZ45DRAFT_745521 [Acephala macrosclerotiorum]
MTTIHPYQCSPVDNNYGPLNFLESNFQDIFSSMSATTTFAILQLVLLIFRSIDKSHGSPVPLISALLSVIAALAICILSWIEHRRSIRPSTLLGVYLLCSLILDIPSARTLFLRGETTAITAPLFVAGMGMKLALLILEAQSKTSCLKDPYSKLSPEAGAGFLNRAVFWINDLMVAGCKRPIEYDDLPVLDFELASDHLQPKISAIHFVSEVDYRSKDNINAKSLIAAAIFIYVIDTALCKHMLNRVMAMFRGVMVGLVYKRSSSLPDGLHEESAAITLMSTDVDIICDTIPTVYELWAQIIEVMIGFGLLWRQIG